VFGHKLAQDQQIGMQGVAHRLSFRGHATLANKHMPAKIRTHTAAKNQGRNDGSGFISGALQKRAFQRSRVASISGLERR
jgi:hypothetical protein